MRKAGHVLRKCLVVHSLKKNDRHGSGSLSQGHRSYMPIGHSFVLHSKMSLSFHQHHTPSFRPPTRTSHRHRHLTAHRAMASSALTSIKLFSREDAWKNLFAHQAGWGSWRGYAGYWYIGGPDGITADVKPMRNIRLWQYTEPGNTDKLTQLNIYEHAAPWFATTPRDHDSYVETYFSRTSDGPYYEPTACDVDGMPGWADRRLVVLNADVHISLKPQVPTRPLTAEEYPPQRSDVVEVPGKWHFEYFIVDGNCKWSSTSTWETTTGTRTLTALVQEFFVDIENVNQPLSMDAMPLMPPRDRLPADPAQWLAGATLVEHSSYGMQVVPETGAFAHAPEQPPCTEAWPPADMVQHLQGGAMDLITLPDSMYLLVPKLMPAFSGQPMRIEFGGIMRSGSGKLLRRVVVKYAVDGRLEAVTHDAFQAL